MAVLNRDIAGQARLREVKVLKVRELLKPTIRPWTSIKVIACKAKVAKRGKIKDVRPEITQDAKFREVESSDSAHHVITCDAFPGTAVSIHLP